MKIFSLIILFCGISSLYSQVGIGTANPNPSTALDIVSQNRGFLGPRIALTSRTDNATIPTPANGILVYNLTTLAGTEATALAPGYYFWYSGRWYPSKKGEIINITTNGTLKTYLGYDATGVHSAANFSNGGINFTGLGCKQWTMASGGNNHWYCAYTGDKSTPAWEEAFNAAKSKGGYLPTFTTLAEWTWFETNILKPTTGYNVTSSVWIGYNKVNFSGNPTEFTWITGETSKILWANNSSTEDYFRSGEPNNTGGNEGCVHIINAGDGTSENKRGWNDITCANPGWSGPYNQIVIEYEQ
ncbi:C-type lectin domain-containing protein [Chryseobacterium arachidis]